MKPNRRIWLPGLRGWKLKFRARKLRECLTVDNLQTFTGPFPPCQCCCLFFTFPSVSPVRRLVCPERSVYHLGPWLLKLQGRHRLFPMRPIFAATRFDQVRRRRGACCDITVTFWPEYDVVLLSDWSDCAVQQKTLNNGGVRVRGTV